MIFFLSQRTLSFEYLQQFSRQQLVKLLFLYFQEILAVKNAVSGFFPFATRYDIKNTFLTQFKDYRVVKRKLKQKDSFLVCALVIYCDVLLFYNGLIPVSQSGCYLIIIGRSFFHVNQLVFDGNCQVHCIIGVTFIFSPISLHTLFTFLCFFVHC